MGKGKGKTHNWISKVSSGTTIIEIGIIPALNILKIENRLKKAWTLSAKLVNDIY
jgi:ribosomal protein L16/L10AE